VLLDEKSILQDLHSKSQKKTKAKRVEKQVTDVGKEETMADGEEEFTFEDATDCRFRSGCESSAFQSNMPLRSSQEYKRKTPNKVQPSGDFD